MHYRTVNPATGVLVEDIAAISDRNLDAILTTAHDTSQKDWRHRPVAERSRIVSEAAAILRETAEYTEKPFGPVASFYMVEGEADAVLVANDTPYGLGASVFTADIERGREVAAQFECGMVFINRPFGTLLQLPLGGVRSSGFGRELSEAGFEEFVNKKLVNTDPVGTPPFGPAKTA